MRAAVLAWSIAALGLGLAAASYVLDLLNGDRFAPPIVGAVVGAAFLIVGALIASHRPRNPIGWLYLVSMTLASFGGSGNLSDQYLYYALVTRPGALPAPDWVAWAGQISIIVGFFSLLLFAPLLFPEGRLPSPRWRPVAIGAACTVASLTVGTAFAPGTLPRFANLAIRNPAAIGLGGALDPLGPPLALLGVGILLASISSIVVRFRHARAIERQQLKWFVYGAAWIPAVALVGLVKSVVAPNLLPGVGENLWPLSVAGIPIATAMAVLRHRLYDIDVLINRTLVYAATTAVIAAAFLAGIVVLQAILRPVTGGSEVAVAVSTLASVALVQPLRARIQRVVDRRFYRSRYDAARTLDEFSVRLRDQVALDALRADLLGAVGDTMQPAHASLWLRERTS
jgi:hypothetical protein